MKILMVNKFLYPRGGAETYMLRIGEELTRRGHQVEYFGMYDEKNTVGNAEGLTTVNMDFHASGAEKLLYPFRIIYSGEARRKMRQVIDRFHPDIIHFNNINFQLTPSVILAGAEKNIPMVQTVHDLQMLCPNHMMMEFGTWKLCEECSGKKCKMACVRKKCIHGSRAKSLIGAIEGTIYTSSHVYDRVARYICPSRFIEEKLLTVPRYAGKTTMIHNFLSKTAEINAPKGDYVLYFGRLSEEKGIDRILAACRLLPEIPFVIAGGGPLEELCRTCGLPNVRFVGFKTGRDCRSLSRRRASPSTSPCGTKTVRWRCWNRSRWARRCCATASVECRSWWKRAKRASSTTPSRLKPMRRRFARCIAIRRCWMKWRAAAARRRKA